LASAKRLKKEGCLMRRIGPDLGSKAALYTKVASLYAI
jgi:hypothetical protein